VRTLLERTGGNPLYLQQLLRTEWAERALTERAHEMASSMDLQQGLIESICRHVDSLSEQARELLTVAAVLGREFELSKLMMVCDLPQKDVLDRLDEAAQARVLVKGKDGAYRFAHALGPERDYRNPAAVAAFEVRIVDRSPGGRRIARPAGQRPAGLRGGPSRDEQQRKHAGKHSDHVHPPGDGGSLSSHDYDHTKATAPRKIENDRDARPSHRRCHLRLPWSKKLDRVVFATLEMQE